MNSLAMEGMDNGKLSLIFRDIFVLSLLFALPLAGLLLTPAALYLHSRHGLFTGKRIVLCAVLLAVPLAWWLSSLSALLLSAPFFAAGAVLVHSASRGDGPVLSIAKAALALAVLWTALLIAVSLVTGQDIYQALVVFLQSALREAAQYSTGEASVETQAMVTETLTQAARLVPVVLPAMMLVPALLAPFAAILLCNTVESLRALPRRWIDFRLWRLPDVLVWVAIVLMAGCYILGGLPRLAAINGLILVVMIYAMQGLAVMKFFFDSRRLPMVAQLVLIFLVVSQSFGLLALAILGLIEVWADFRRLGRRKPRINLDKE